MPQTYHQLGWNSDIEIARDNDGNHDAANCADSACFYLLKRNNMLKHLDAGTTQDDAIVVSKDVNGYVSIENLNGLDCRPQAIAYLKTILLDEILQTSTC